MHADSARQDGILQILTPGNAQVIVAGIETAGSAAKRHHMLDIKFCDGKSIVGFADGKNTAVFRGQAETGPGMVGRAFPCARRCQQKAAAELAGLITGVEFGFVTGGNRFREGRHLNNDGCPRLGMTRTRRGETVQTGTDLNGNAQISQSTVLEQNAVSLKAAAGLRKIKMGVESLHRGNKRPNFTVVQHGGRVENPGTVSEGKPDKDKHIQAFRIGQYFQQGAHGTVKKNTVREKITAAAACQRKRREYQQAGILFGCPADTVYDSVGIIVRIRYPNDRGCGNGFYKPVFHAEPPDQRRTRAAR